MGLDWNFYLLLALISSSSILLTNAQPASYPSVANLNSSWINTASDILLNDSLSTLKIVLLRESSSQTFLCGFHCYIYSDECLFGVSILPKEGNPYSDISSSLTGARLVWSANPHNPVKTNATLQLTQKGNLYLFDVDNTLIWSVSEYALGYSVMGLNLTETGNLVLFGPNNVAVWQSFHHPTDALLPGQLFVSGHKLTKGLYSLTVNSKGLVAYIESNPPQAYYTSMSGFGFENATEGTGPEYDTQFVNGTFQGFMLRPASSPQFMQLKNDGHFVGYQWGQFQWSEVADLLNRRGECLYPMVCGKYSICSSGQCTCPESARSNSIYFRQVHYKEPKYGCSPVIPLSCQSSKYHDFLHLEDVYYFTFNVDIKDTDRDNCKQVCLDNCSCKAALFRYKSNVSIGDCCLLSEVFSLNNEKSSSSYDPTLYNTSTFLKVQNSQPRFKKKARQLNKAVLLGPIFGAAMIILFLINKIYNFFGDRRGKRELEDDHLDHIQGMCTRFSYDDLKAATQNFSTKLGQGGFGSVFLGTLSDGSKIAVKCLEGLRQVKKTFLAEIETVGSIHHLNLVRLIGFCSEKSQRLLVYEYMTNGSLDIWLFHRKEFPALNWQARKKIILGVAKGLTYLHEDCRQKIIHFDIKPQNILLDENFNAKVSDFGLSKLVEREKSKVVTTMKGTPGYLAPEWLGSVITEKVDVYSFGIVVLETLSGRKIFDQTQPEEDMHLLEVFRRKAEEEQLLDIMDEVSLDIQKNEPDILQMVRIAGWCLQRDFTKRPSMSTVVKIMEGSVTVEGDLKYVFSNPPEMGVLEISGYGEAAAENEATPLLPSILSGPR